MGMTMTQKILAAHAGLKEVTAGQLITCKLDLVHGNDITTPVAVNVFKNIGVEHVFNKEKLSYQITLYLIRILNLQSSANISVSSLIRWEL